MTKTKELQEADYWYWSTYILKVFIIIINSAVPVVY